MKILVGDSFEQKQKMKNKRVSHGVAVLNGNIQIIGWCDGVSGKTFNSCEMRSLSDDKLILTSPMIFKCSKHGCWAHKSKICVCGGKDSSASTRCERLVTKGNSVSKQMLPFYVWVCSCFLWHVYVGTWWLIQ